MFARSRKFTSQLLFHQKSFLPGPPPPQKTEEQVSGTRGHPVLRHPYLLALIAQTYITRHYSSDMRRQKAGEFTVQVRVVINSSLRCQLPPTAERPCVASQSTSPMHFLAFVGLCQLLNII